MMNYSYKRYWEPSTTQVLASSVAIGAVASTLTYPLEFVKTRIQVRAEGIGIRQRNHLAGYNPFRIFREIHQTGVGFRGLFNGLDSHILSRCSYLFIRNFLYKVIYDQFKPKKPTNDLTTREKAVIAAFAGGVAAYVSNPFELINIRQIADGGIYQPHRRNYQNFFDGYNKIMSGSQGSSTLFNGVWAHVLKAVILNISLTGPYDYMKEKCYVTFGDWEPICSNVALVWAAFWATCATLPFDNIKTRLQKQFSDPSKNRLNYHGYMDCWRQAFSVEGVYGLWSGFYAFFLRTYFYAFLTVQATDYITTEWKQRAGLRSWEI